MNEFDLKAADWDQNPMHWERSEAIANEIIRLIPLNKKMKALEYGAGTGITSFLLKDRVREITLMDNSVEMVKIIDKKIETTKVKNLKALNFDLEHGDYKEARFDLIFTQMVLHHVVDIENIMAKFSSLLNPGGYLAIADLYKEDGSFHGEGFTGHNGFDIEELSNQIRNIGFSEISERKVFVINKMITNTKSKKFDVFLLIATK
jgi:tRNA (cmo5U34)-methyltransferase